MPYNINNITLTGNLVRDPDLRITAGGKNVCSFDIAVNCGKNASGEDESIYVRIITWERLADNCNQYLEKGNKVCVVGKLKNPQAWIGKQDGKAHGQCQVDAINVEFLSTANDGRATRRETFVPPPNPYGMPASMPANWNMGNTDNPAPKLTAATAISDDDLPF